LVLFVKKSHSDLMTEFTADYMRGLGDTFSLTVPLSVTAKGGLERWAK
jgi:hypothetical protein